MRAKKESDQTSLKLDSMRSKLEETVESEHSLRQRLDAAERRATEFEQALIEAKTKHAEDMHFYEQEKNQNEKELAMKTLRFQNRLNQLTLALRTAGLEVPEATDESKFSSKHATPVRTGRILRQRDNLSSLKKQLP